MPRLVLPRLKPGPGTTLSLRAPLHRAHPSGWEYRLVVGLMVVAAVAVPRLSAQASGTRTYCNPLDIEYRYSLKQVDQKISYRAGADPVIVNHKGAYYLFVTNPGGWWRSTDLGRWRFVTPDRWLDGDINAPAALSVRDTMYLFPSAFEPAPLFFTTTPE